MTAIDTAACVRDVMTTRLVTVTPDDSLVAAWELMARGDIHHLPVIEGRRCVSLLDDRVVATALAGIVTRPRRRIRDVMAARVHCILPTDSLKRAAEVMDLERATALPVVDDAMNLVGLVTDRDIVHAVAQGFALAPSRHSRRPARRTA